MKDTRDFLVNRDETGREVVFFPETGKRYFVEYIGSTRSNWGDVDPASGKIQGSYGEKYKGSINKEETLITEENGFKEIVVGMGSPYDTIEKRHNEYKQKLKG